MSDLTDRAKALLAAQRYTQKPAAKAATDTAHGSASFAAPPEIAASDLKTGSLLMGRSDNGFLRYGGNGHLLTFAPTGAGKSVSVVVPNLLNYPGSIVCIDPKGAIAPITAARRHAMGQKIVLLDPFGEVERATAASGRAGAWPKILRSTYNPLSQLDANSPDVVDDARLIASSLILQENDKNRYFSDSARAVLEGLILFLLASGGRNTMHFENLLDIAFDSKIRFKEHWLPEMREYKDFDGHILRLANQIEDFSDEGGAAVWSTLRRSLGLLQSPRLLSAMQSSPVDLRNMKSTPSTVYLVLPAKHLHTHGAWLRLMLAVIINQLSDARPSKYPVLFIVDECAALGRLEILETAVGLMRGYGLKLWLVFQDLAQLKSVYSGRWESFISNSGVKQFFNVNDLETADFVSKYLGQETRYVQSESISSSTALPGSNISATGRALLTADEVRRLGRDEQILFYEGQKPVQAKKLSYWQDAEFKGTFLPDPYVSAGS